MFLFKVNHIDGELERRRTNIAHEIQKIDRDEFLRTDANALLEWLVAEYCLDVPTLRHSETETTHVGDANIDMGWDRGRDFGRSGRSGDTTVSGTWVVYAIPFEGDPKVFDMFVVDRGSYPMADVQEGEIHITVSAPSSDSAALRRDLDHRIREIEFHLEHLRRVAADFKAELERDIPVSIQMRRQKILADKKMLEGIGYPMRRRPDAPPTYRVPDIRRKPRISKPTPSREKFEPEPTVEMEEYENILNVLQHMVLVMEKSPTAFKVMREEHLRDHFLVQLNGQYEGRATGETFNAYGKTDIIIKEGARNLFIAECKFWDGPRRLIEALDQLFDRYLTWRDTKVALLVFNRKGDFTNVLKSIQETVPTHPVCKRQIKVLSETSFRYLFHHPNDTNRDIILTVLAFYVPT